MPVGILADSREGVWVTGLPETVRVITVGQEYVAHGARVRALPDERAGTAGAPAVDAAEPVAPAAEMSEMAPIGNDPSDEPSTEAAAAPANPTNETVEPEAMLVPVTDIRSSETLRDVTDRPATGDELTLAETPPAPPQRPQAGALDVSLLAR